MINNSSGNRNKRQGVSIPDFKRETEREYQYAKRPNRQDLREKETNQVYQKRRRREEEIERRNVIRNRKSKEEMQGIYRNRSNQSKATNSLQVKNSPSQNSGKKKNASKKRRNHKIYKNILIASMFCVAVLVGHLLGRVHAQVNQVLSQK